MRNISDTIARLAAINGQSRTGYLPSNGAASKLGTLTMSGGNPGALDARSYLPAHLPKGAPLVVVLHGCTQSAAAYDYHSGWSRLADQAEFALLYPEQRRSNNQNLCFNWFQAADVMRDAGEVSSIRQMIEEMVVAHGLDRKRIFITGLSAGGAMAAAMLACYPEVFAGGGIIAGLPFGSASTIPQAFDRMRGHGGPSHQELRSKLRDASDYRGPWPKISIWQGTEDKTVAASNADAIANQWWGVHQVESTPTHAETDGKNTFRVWCDASGAPAIEVNIIAGMGHGTPIDSDILGSPGPYMLDVGVSSTQAIARFWGIAGANNNLVNNRSRQPAISKSGDTSPDSQSDAAPGGVKKVIEDALRAAGLMR